MRRAALIGALGLLAIMPATAHAAGGFQTERFKVSVKGVQTNVWSYNHPDGGRCNPGGSGEGTEVVRFASTKPQGVEATRLSPKYVQFGSGETAGALTARAKITRRRATVDGPMDPLCGGKGGGGTRAPDCGTKRAPLALTLSYEAFAKPRGLKLRSQTLTDGDPFQNCLMNGYSFPDLLDETTNGGGIASAWPVREIMDGRVGKTIVIGRGRKVLNSDTSRYETTIRWEVTFRRLRPPPAGAAVATAAASAAYKGKTENGGSISFRLSGNTISRVNGAVPTVCLETMGSNQRRSGVELFQPPGSFRLGRTAKTKALQPAAMNQGIKATKNYTFSSRPAGDGRVKGRLKLSFSFLRPGPSIYQSYIYVCSSSVSFSAKERS